MRWIVLSVLALAGCATAPATPSPSDLSAALNTEFASRSPDRMVDRYGPPAEQKDVNGRHFYVWHTARSMTWSGPTQTATTTGVIEGAYYSQSTQIPTRETETYQCSMAAEIASDGAFLPARVAVVRIAGQMGACQAFTP